MKKLCLIICSLAFTGSLMAADYFPLTYGSTWTFSYKSRSAPVVPNPVVMVDSGTVQWESMVLFASGGSNLLTPVKQTKSLFRRTVTGGPLPEYDSIFSPPRISIDTITFQQTVIVVDSLNPKADSIENAISFFTTECPVAVHDPAGSMPTEVIVTDTVVPFLNSGTTKQCKITGSQPCSCYKGKLWSFALAPDIGPVEAYITICPGWVGVSYSESRKLVSYSFPTSKIKDNPGTMRFPEMKIARTGTTIACSFGASVKPSSVMLYSVSGREVARFADGGSGRFTADASLAPAGCYVLMARTINGVFNTKLWLGK